MARALGIEVYQASKWPDELSGMVKRSDTAESGFRITFNANHPKVRRRFTVAHEIAHTILHPDLIGDGILDDALWRSGLPNEVEYQANRMAADILMPKHLVVEEFKSVTDPVALARIFEVSNKSMGIRLDRLGLSRYAA